MTVAFQLAVFALIVTSSILLISVPVVFASPDCYFINLLFLLYLEYAIVLAYNLHRISYHYTRNDRPYYCYP
ncbi:hypothetical protein RHGRI_024047 [Rhododendron griersonianum]|uniref:Photosystem II reaction center protein Z n=1 Tax=Rhododendron griersonianum TaxID=479676 RepID=A0AAV6J862_9ERIC|nr:hypothetical protein RHGRI_024047 [Rhododendron griersonianum]